MPRRNSKFMTEPGIAKMAKAPKGKRIERFDSGADGLALRITDRGAKTWCISYHFPDDQGQLKHHRYTIGPWPAIGLAQAREEARKVKAQAKAGFDPKVARAGDQTTARTKAQAEARSTFRVIAENYINRECSRLKRGREYEAAIRRELLPTWGARPIADLRRLHLIELTDALLDAGKPMAAYRVYEIAKRILNWAMERGEIEASPFAMMKPPAPKVMRDRVLKPDEIKPVWEAWGAMDYPYGPLSKLLLMTAQRLNEVAQMQWCEIDRDNALWAIAADRTKSGRETEVPLSSLALEILDDLPRFTDGDYVFTTTGGRQPVSGFNRMKTRSDKLSGVSGWRLHDLRRSARTGLAELGVPEIIAEMVLNHAPRGTLTKIYNRHEYSAEKRNALERWALRLREITEPAPENVVKLKAKR